VHRQIDQDREHQERDEGGHRPVTHGINALAKRFDHPGRRAHSSVAIALSVSNTHKNHADPDGQGPIVNMRHQKWKKIEIGRFPADDSAESSDNRRSASRRGSRSKTARPIAGTVWPENLRTPARKAVTNEQPGNEEHAGHEETVIEQHDQIESEPAHPVAIAEIGVNDD